jgi:hypothetical protein
MSPAFQSLQSKKDKSPCSQTSGAMRVCRATTTFETVVASQPPTPYHTAPEESTSSSPSPSGSLACMDVENVNNNKETINNNHLRASESTASTSQGTRSKRISTIRKVQSSIFIWIKYHIVTFILQKSVFILKEILLT